MNIEQSYARHIAANGIADVSTVDFDTLDFDAEADVLRSACFEMVSLTSTPPVFVRPSTSLLERIDHSDLGSMTIGELPPLAFGGFVVDLGKRLSPEGDERPVVRRVFNSICVQPHGLCVVVSALKQGGWVDCPVILPSNETLSSLMTFRPVESWERDIQHFFSQVVRWTVGTAIYLCTPSASLQDHKGRTIAREGESLILPPIRTKHKLRRRQQEKEAQKQRRFVAGRDLEPLKAHANTIVRGHFRNQAHGPRRQLRKLIWIQPHLRHKDESFPVLGRDVSVEAA